MKEGYITLKVSKLCKMPGIQQNLSRIETICKTKTQTLKQSNTQAQTPQTIT